MSGDKRARRKKGQRGVLSEQQKRFFAFLKKMETKKAAFSCEDIAEATGWAVGTPRDYLRKGYLAENISKSPDGMLTVRGVVGLTEAQFLSKITQTQSGRVFASRISDPLARSFVERSRDNMILALELYNRPSLGNRIDGFVLLFSTAWEQLLKAEIVEREQDAEAILRPVDRSGRRLSFSLGECLSRVTSLSPLVTRNVERIKELRDQAAHFLVPELQNPLGFLFQAGVLNFERHFAKFTGETFLPANNGALMSLVSEATLNFESDSLAVKYGQRTAASVLELSATLREEITATADSRFAIPLDYRLKLTNKVDESDFIIGLSTPDNRAAVIMTEAKDPDTSHPFSTSEAEKEINERLKARHGSESELKRLLGPNGRLSSRDFQALVHRKNWKKSKNCAYHFKLENPTIHRYSLRAIEDLVELLSTQPQFLSSARSHYSNSVKKRKAKAK